MVTTKKNPLWSFFASVKLALLLLSILAVTSIIGTIIPQNKEAAFYSEKYGNGLASLFQALQIPDMYNAWWFLLLLLLFSCNLIVCSLERIPTAWRLVTRNNLETDPERLGKMAFRRQFTLSCTAAEAYDRVQHFMTERGWKPSRREKNGGVLFFAQKGGWSRFGVYIVHLSILVILLGALIGSSRIARNVLRQPGFAFKGSIMLPEKIQTDQIRSFIGGMIQLPFTVRCDSFAITYYANGMPKEYLSRLTVLENGQEIRSVDVEVNKPLTHRGVTFYQSSYQPFREITVTISDGKNQRMEQVVEPGRQFSWEEGGVRYGVINLEAMGEAVARYKVWFTDGQGEPSTFWIENNREAVVERPSGTYHFRAKQLYATGLQVARDPGVWVVYLGCVMMLAGLCVAFFLSHRKLYAFVRQEERTIHVLFAGSAHKNTVGLEKHFQQLLERFP